MTPRERARAVADAVLYEGFYLYPYTRGALKNRSRFQFGVLMPQGYADASEPSSLRTQLLAAAEPSARIAACLRFLHVRDDAVEREIPLDLDVREGATALTFAFDDLCGMARCIVERDGEYVRITFEAENRSSIDPGARRDEAIPYAFVGVHVVVEIERGCFISLLDPPQAAQDAAARCRNRGTFPVLAGEPADAARQTSAIALASPIILYDFPSVAEKSPGHTFDGTEIDELLLLSVAALTDDEKREARETHARTRAIVDRADAFTGGLQERLHGEIAIGSAVRVHPKRRADAFDIFADGKTARVKGIHDDVEGRRYVSVVFDDDPASDLHEWYGRSFFYETDEVEQLRTQQ